ncbi:MAG TPA: hypothetical protein VIT92_04065 [Burkholderiaceae bacterium]
MQASRRTPRVHASTFDFADSASQDKPRTLMELAARNSARHVLAMKPVPTVAHDPDIAKLRSKLRMNSVARGNQVGMQSLADFLALVALKNRAS